MSNLLCTFYDLLKPSSGEVVLVTFTAYKDSHIEGKLVEYTNDVFMNYSDATKKRSVASWKKIVPLDKPMIAVVEDNDSDIIQVSLSYLNDDAQNAALMDQFNKNNLLISFFKKLSILGKKDITDLWKAIIYPIDEHRRDEYDPENMPCLFDYCNEEREFVESVFDDSGNSEIYSKFIELLDNVTKEKAHKIVSKIEIISNGGIKNTMELFRKAVETIDFNYTLRYDTAPTFLFESSSVESSEEDHTKFVKFLETEGQKLNPKTFVRCIQTPKEST